MVKVMFMGTPMFAKRILEQLYLEENAEVIAVVTQPDQPVGRKQVMTPPEVKVLAQQHNTPVYQPVKLRKEYGQLLSLGADMIITCAYGQIVPDEVLNCVPLGAFNLHASLLPKLRGGAPIQRAIMNGMMKTGMTLMKMSSRMDAGDMIAKSEVEIEQSDDYGTLEEKLMDSGVKLLHEWFDRLCAKDYTAEPQKEEEATFAPIIRPEEEKITFTGNYRDVYNHIRGLLPRPGVYAKVEDRILKFWHVSVSEMTTDRPDGEILPFIGGNLCVALAGRVLVFEEVQYEGKKRCAARDFKNGVGRTLVGKRFY